MDLLKRDLKVRSVRLLKGKKKREVLLNRMALEGGHWKQWFMGRKWCEVELYSKRP